LLVLLGSSTVVICAADTDQGLQCSLCGHPITGKYWQGGGLVFCDQCYHGAAHCASCGLPVKNFHTTADGRFICAACLRKLPRCTLCNDPVTSQYWTSTSTVTGTQRQVCTNCYPKTDRCSVCGHMTPRNSRHLSDGRTLCSECWKSAVIQYQSALAVYSQANSIIKSTLGLHISRTPNLLLVGRPELTAAQQTLGSNNEADASGLCYAKIMYREGGPINGTVLDHRIYVLYGLPLDEMLRVLAHELGHAWFNEHCPENQSATVVEGFADWVAYKVMQFRGFTEAMKHMSERQDVYGEGLRLMLKTERSGKIPAILKLIHAR